MKKHDINMIATWAKDWGVSGYDHLDPKEREYRRQRAIKKHNERVWKESEKKNLEKYS